MPKYKLRPEMENLIGRVIESLEENGMLEDVLELLREKRYLDKEEKPTSIADAQWIFEAGIKGYTVCDKRVVGQSWAPDIANTVPTKELATTIAALPDLVKAAKGALHVLQNLTGVYHENETVAIRGIEEALEKAGESL